MSTNRLGKKRPLSRGMMMMELALKKGKKCDASARQPQSAGDHGAATASQSESARDHGAATVTQSESARDHGAATASQSESARDHGAATASQSESARDHGAATASQSESARDHGAATASQSESARDHGAATASQSESARHHGAATASQSESARDHGAATASQSESARHHGAATASQSESARHHGAATATQSESAGDHGAATVTQSEPAWHHGAATATQSESAGNHGAATASQSESAGDHGAGKATQSESAWHHGAATVTQSESAWHHGAATASQSESAGDHGAAKATQSESAWHHGAATATQSESAWHHGAATVTQSEPAWHHGAATATQSESAGNHGAATASQSESAGNHGAATASQSESAGDHGAAKATQSESAWHHGAATATQSESAGDHGVATATHSESAGDHGGATTSQSESAGDCIPTPPTILNSAQNIDQTVFTLNLFSEELVTFTSMVETDLETLSMSDVESLLDDNILDETYNPTKDKQEETESSNNSGESEQEEEKTEEESNNKPKRKKGINYRKQNMENRRLGKEYKGKKKAGGENIEVTRSPRSIGDRCNHGCNEGQVRNKGGQLCANINEEQRQKIFTDFWNMTWGQRMVYVSSQVEACPPRRKTTEGPTRKNRTYQYKLLVDNKQIPVCQTMLLSTLNIGAWSVHEWVKSPTGMHRVALHQKMPSRSRCQQDGSAQEFLNGLPKVESHYCRRDTKKMYLEPVFNTLSALHREYQNYCGEHAREAVHETTLKTVFKQMNLSLFKPKKDQCDLCVQFEEGNLDKEAYEKHVKRKDMARKQKTLDKESYAEDQSTVVLTVDLESVLLAPVLKASALYYRTKLACHNYTIYDLHSHDAKCYFWHEGEGGLDADTFASCLLDYLNNNERCKAASTIIVYSDGCTYQNRNKVLANSLYDFCCKTKKTVFQKILEKGHTQMECDSVHAACERALRDKKIYVPSNYKTYIEGARPKQPYIVEYLKHDFFKTYNDLTYFSTIRPGHKVGDPVVTDIRQFRYKDGSLEFKLDYSESEFLPLPHRCKENTGLVRRKYAEAPKIKKSKYEDLQALKTVLPHDYHSFYDGLLHHTT